jgi:hypothetical protein
VSPVASSRSPPRLFAKNIGRARPHIENRPLLHKAAGSWVDMVEI